MTAHQTIDTTTAMPISAPKLAKDWRTDALNAPDYEIWFDMAQNNNFKRSGFFAFEFLKIAAGGAILSALFSAIVG